MALLEILEFPDSRLRTKAKPVQNVDGRIAQLADDMLETMYAAPGIGLAASQVNVHQQLIVIDISEDKNDLLVLINPEIIQKKGKQEYEEGCLSVPGFYEAVERFDFIKVKSLNTSGKFFEFEARGLLSVCIQHEMDHLEGKVFVEYLSPLKQNRIKRKLIKQRKNKS